MTFRLTPQNWGSHPGPLVLALVQDLFFGTRIADGLTRLGCRPVVSETAGPEDLALGPALVIADLSAPRSRWEPLIQAARAAGVPVLAFGSHLDVESQAAARAAGAGRVVAKGKLTADFAELVQEMLAFRPCCGTPR